MIVLYATSVNVWLGAVGTGFVSIFSFLSYQILHVLIEAEDCEGEDAGAGVVKIGLTHGGDGQAGGDVDGFVEGVEFVVDVHGGNAVGLDLAELG